MTLEWVLTNEDVSKFLTDADGCLRVWKSKEQCIKDSKELTQKLGIFLMAYPWTNASWVRPLPPHKRIIYSTELQEQERQE